MVARDGGKDKLMRDMAKHPILYGLGFGVMIGFLGGVARAPRWMCVLFGVVMFALVLVLYMPGGVGRRWVDRLPPED